MRTHHSLAGDRWARVLVPAYFCGLAILCTWPLVRHISTAVPGAGADDNLAAVWNFWWMRQSLSTGLASFFHTDFLFYPFGTDLVLHNHTALTTFVGATLLGRLPVVAALNVTVIGAFVANGVAAYVLAVGRTGHRAAAILAGTVFAASPLLTTHLQAGHFNYFTAWGLPLFAAVALKAFEASSLRRACVAGLVLAAVGYTDYYYFIYACVFLACLIASRWITRIVTRRQPSVHSSPAIDRALIVIALAAVGVSVWIASTGGGVLALGSRRISFTTGVNIRTVAWVAMICWAWRRAARRVDIRFTTAVRAVDVKVAAALGGVAVLALSPVIVAAAQLWIRGDYVTQRYLWRSAPGGIDLATTILGNPFNSVTGGWTLGWYDAANISPLPAWCGIAPILIVLLTRRAWWPVPEARRWVTIGGVFFIWALGPHLIAFGARSGLLLPQILLRYVPIVANARMPGYAMVGAFTAFSVILAIAVAKSRLGASRATVTCLVLATLVDFISVPLPMHQLDPPGIYEALKSLPPGAVLNVPLGIRDGFGAVGRFDPAVMYFQTIHGKPVLGGYLARVSPRITEQYQAVPVLRELLTLSETPGATVTLPSGQAASIELKTLGVRYIVVDTEMAAPEVQRFVSTFSTTIVARDGRRILLMLE